MERETAAPSLETECGMDGGLGSAPSGQETLLGLVDGGCGGSEVKLEGDAEKAADPARREESTSSSCFDSTSTTKKNKSERAQHHRPRPLLVWARA